MRLALGISLAIGAAGAYAGCSSDGAATDAPVDAGSEAAVPSEAGPEDAPGPTGCEAERGSDGLYGTLRCAGFYADFDAKTVDPALRSYEPGLQLWADGATKQRWIGIPPGMKIDTSNVDEWVFPNGTKVWKEFSLDGKRVETRLYQKGDDGSWHHTSYRWNAAETDAVRSDSGEEIPRGAGAPPYVIPSGNQCNECHQGRKDKLLGFEAVSLAAAGAKGLTLATLVAEGLVTTPPSSTSLVFPEDATGKAASALAWLHVSCGPCHNRSSAASGEKSRVYMLSHASELLGVDGGAGSGTVATLDAFTTTVGKTSMVAIPDGGGATFQIIKASDPSASLVSYLSGRRVPANGTPNEKDQMPPIVTRLVDTSGHALLDTWISALPP